MKRFLTPLILTLAFLVFSGCVTQKKKDDVGTIGKIYHNTTARYNGYYNAGLLLAESTLALEQQHQDNYNRLLPIYKYVEADNPKAVAEDLDEATKKMSVVVNLHRVSHWSDDCYLLVGQAQYLKQDYESAEETLEFLVGEYDPREVAKREAKAKAKKGKKKAIKKGKAPEKSSEVEEGEEEEVQLTKKEKEKLAAKKKKDREKERKQKIKETKKKRKGKGSSGKEKVSPDQPKAEKKAKEKPADKKKKPEAVKEPEETLPAPGSVSLGNMEPEVTDETPQSYNFKHRPAYQSGLLWLARTYIERQNYTGADRLLSQLEKSGGTFKDVRQEAAVARAHYFIEQKQYDKAIEPLETAIELGKDNKMKARLAFILGQIHQMNGNDAAAGEAFQRALKFRPDYEMEFSARLNLATSGSESEASVKQLERMLKEDKNKDFQDQIYFALAEIALKKGDKKGGIKYLEMSLAKSSRNISQKAESYLLLADLYFEDQAFVKAKLYFDSTLLVLTPADERYIRVSRLAFNLEEIAKNIQIVTLQDSLLAISTMSDEEREELAAKIKKKQDAEKLRLLKEAAEKQNDLMNIPRKGGPAPAGTGNSKFWAYNEEEKKDGKRDFQRRWGTRSLEDNWRRSNRPSFAEQAGDLDGSENLPDLTEEDVNEILKDVPDSPEEVTAANRQIEAALFGLGGLYRDKLENYPKSVEALEELLRRYPETQYQLDALYYLYLSYQDMNDAKNTQLYYDKIVLGYPTSNYARILKDPNFLKSLAEQQNKLGDYYDETYSAFERRQYQTAYDRIAKVGEMFGATNKLQSRFALLSAMCTGNLQGKEKYVEALKEVIAKYNDAPEAARAREILRLLGETGSLPGQNRDLPAAEGQVGPYKIADDQLHYVIVVFRKDISLNDAKIAITEYNQKYHDLQKLKMNNIYLGDGDAKLPLVAIRRYKDKKEAMDYYGGIQKNKKDFLDAAKYDYEVFPISQDNYRELLKVKNVEEYRTFFAMNYAK